MKCLTRLKKRKMKEIIKKLPGKLRIKYHFLKKLLLLKIQRMT